MSELTKEQREALEWAILPPAEWDSVPEHMNNIHRATIRAMLAVQPEPLKVYCRECECYHYEPSCPKDIHDIHAPACKTCGQKWDAEIHDRGHEYRQD